MGHITQLDFSFGVSQNKSTKSFRVENRAGNNANALNTLRNRHYAAKRDVQAVAGEDARVRRIAHRRPADGERDARTVG